MAHFSSLHFPLVSCWSRTFQGSGRKHLDLLHSFHPHDSVEEKCPHSRLWYHFHIFSFAILPGSCNFMKPLARSILLFWFSLFNDLRDLVTHEGFSVTCYVLWSKVSWSDVLCWTPFAMRSVSYLLLAITWGSAYHPPNCCSDSQERTSGRV